MSGVVTGKYGSVCPDAAEGGFGPCDEVLVREI